MASTTQILAIVGAIIFGAWFFNKAGCNTDIEALCWNGPSLEEMLSGGGGGGQSIVEAAEDFIPHQTGGGITPAAGPARRTAPARGRSDFLKEQAAAGCKPGESEDACQRRQLTVARQTGLAHAYFVNNRITLA